MANYFILDGRKPVNVGDVLEWGKWFETHQGWLHVAKTDIGNCYVSTIFLGLDRSFGSGPPLLFETMVFDNSRTDREHELYCRRCSTWEEAEEQHRRAVAWAGCCAPHVVKKETEDEKQS